MNKFIRTFVILAIFKSSLVYASEPCVWENENGFSFETVGYMWGGSSFSTLDECGVALRATLIFVDFGQGNGTGEITFVDHSGLSYTCEIKTITFPYSEPSPEFKEVMLRASNGKSSASEVAKFRNYIDANLEITCP